MLELGDPRFQRFELLARLQQHLRLHIELRARNEIETREADASMAFTFFCESFAG